ncbi:MULTISPECIES: Crp/Fnr family transcriptional regulator [Chryseobacterium]|uniref:Crp/Fnr family transcriptional regulator n=1 Tax=Chryseobacterium TaxID=59732 RepID=UPI001BE5B5A0|nr:Crp/Fnr family transcriptional regulator [Chryseobacterium paludis]MBT2623337.1 Crp/Fnr family transcriptional regulator [Chryseobacterium sp. ISL-6]
MTEYNVAQFVDILQSLFPLSDSEKQTLISGIKALNLKSGDSIIKENTTANDLFFLQKGLVRSFYFKDYKEINTEFFFENNFLTALTSFLTGEKTKLNFHCIEDCEIIVIPKNLIDQLLSEDNKWYRLTHTILENEFIKKCRRESSFLLHDSAERYFYFLSLFPKSETRIPLFHIASYLGISPETLSRIRSRKVDSIDISQVDNI